MNYGKVEKAIFLNRPNRFIAEVLLCGVMETVHVKNTGRCRELLVKGATVYLEKSTNPARKTKYDLIAVEKGELLINIDSQIPNAVCLEWLKASNVFSENAEYRREVTYGSSRFDIFVRDGERRAFIEVKGVTLETDGVVMFPDAPTLRGTKHLMELVKAVSDGYEAYVVFIVQMKGPTEFRVNDLTDPNFGRSLRHAADAGVKFMAIDCKVTENTIQAENEIKINI
ncbi:MAG: DNA/RNA nuclease SfsA [Clostridia bacterium]|nr:DNA/RNA nuclease SfsA [Clostridia bacterium]